MTTSETALLFDEHILSSTAHELRNKGIEVEAVYETELQIKSDREILHYATKTRKVIVT